MLFEHDNIVVGSSIEALLYGFINDYPVYYAECRKPHEFEFLHNDVTLAPLLIENNDKIYKSIESHNYFGIPKLFLWEKLYFLLSMRGLMPLSNMCDNIRYDGVSLICSNEYSKLCEIKFDNCYYFGDNKTYKLVNERKIKNVRYKTFDRFGFNRGGKHEVDYLETDDNFVRKVWFYSSHRICGNTGVKDACVFSILTDEQLRDNSFTQTMTAFKLIDLMKNNGMRGKFNGYTKTGTPRYYNFRTSHIDRTIFLIDYPEWDETNNVKKVNLPINDMIALINEKDLSEYKYLNGP